MGTRELLILLGVANIHLHQTNPERALTTKYYVRLEAVEQFDWLVTIHTEVYACDRELHCSSLLKCGQF